MLLYQKLTTRKRHLSSVVNIFIYPLYGHTSSTALLPSITTKIWYWIQNCPPCIENILSTFADDSLLFCKASSQAHFKVKRILDTYCQPSGQLINFHKSSLVFSKNSSQVQKNHVAGIFNIPHRSSLQKYQGCLVFKGRPKLDSFQELISKAEKKLTN